MTTFSTHCRTYNTLTEPSPRQWQEEEGKARLCDEEFNLIWRKQRLRAFASLDLGSATIITYNDYYATFVRYLGIPKAPAILIERRGGHGVFNMCNRFFDVIVERSRDGLHHNQTQTWAVPSKDRKDTQVLFWGLGVTGKSTLGITLSLTWPNINLGHWRTHSWMKYDRHPRRVNKDRFSVIWFWIKTQTIHQTRQEKQSVIANTDIYFQLTAVYHFTIPDCVAFVRCLHAVYLCHVIDL